MSKLLTIDGMLEAAFDSNMPGLPQFVEQAELLATTLAKNLASHLGIESADAVWQSEAFGGLCARFGKAKENDPCPVVIHQADQSGDWDFLPWSAVTKAQLRPHKMALPSD